MLIGYEIDAAINLAKGTENKHCSNNVIFIKTCFLTFKRVPILTFFGHFRGIAGSDNVNQSDVTFEWRTFVVCSTNRCSFSSSAQPWLTKRRKRRSPSRAETQYLGKSSVKKFLPTYFTRMTRYALMCMDVLMWKVPVVRGSVARGYR